MSARHLGERGFTSEAIKVFEKTWTVASPNEDLAGALYHLYMEKGELGLAQKVLRRYEEVMRKDEVPNAESRIIVEKIMASSAS